MYRSDKQFMKNPATAPSRIYIGNIAENVIAADLDDKFKQHGKILGLVLQRGFGFIQYENESNAQSAIRAEHGSLFYGRKLNVKQALDKTRPGTVQPQSSYVPPSAPQPPTAHPTVAPPSLLQKHISPPDFGGPDVVESIAPLSADSVKGNGSDKQLHNEQDFQDHPMDTNINDRRKPQTSVRGRRGRPERGGFRGRDNQNRPDYEQFPQEEFNTLPPRDQIGDMPQVDLPPRDLPPRDLPPRDLPPRDLPLRDLPPRNLPPRDLPPRDLPPRDLGPRDLPPRDLPPRDLPPRDLPPRDLPPRDLPPRDLPPRDLPPRNLPPRDVKPPYFGREEGYRSSFVPPPVMERPERNDCEIIVVSRLLTEYAEYIETRLKNLGLMVDLLYPNEDVPLGRVLANISSRGCLYAILVMPQNEECRSLTLSILHGISQEHRNMPIDDAITLITHNFDAYMRGEKVDSKILGSETASLTDRHPEPMQMLFNLLAENRQISTTQYDRLIKYLQDRRELQSKFEIAEGNAEMSVELEPNSKQAELQSRIMNILNKSNDDVPKSLDVPPPQSDGPTPLLKDPSVQKALDSLILGDMFKSISSNY